MLDLTKNGTKTIQPRGNEVITKGHLQDGEDLGTINTKPINGWLEILGKELDMQVPSKQKQRRVTASKGIQFKKDTNADLSAHASA